MQNASTIGIPSEVRPTPRKNIRLLAIWGAISLVWIAAVMLDVCHRATLQASAANEIQRELDGATGGTSAANGWTGIVRTYFQFGSGDILQWAAGPPIGLLVLGSGAAFMRRRRQADQKTRT